MHQENQRREARVETEVPAWILRGKAETALITSDVSFKGMFIRTTQPPALRSLIRLRVALPDQMFEAHAMVVHVASAPEHDAGVGLQFWGLSGSARKAWDDFVQGLVQARRAPAKSPLIIQTPPHPAGSEPVSGVRIVPHGVPAAGHLPGAARGTK